MNGVNQLIWYRQNYRVVQSTHQIAAPPSIWRGSFDNYQPIGINSEDCIPCSRGCKVPVRSYVARAPSSSHVADVFRLIPQVCSNYCSASISFCEHGPVVYKSRLRIVRVSRNVPQRFVQIIISLRGMPIQKNTQPDRSSIGYNFVQSLQRRQANEIRVQAVING